MCACLALMVDFCSRMADVMKRRHNSLAAVFRLALISKHFSSDLLSPITNDILTNDQLTQTFQVNFTYIHIEIVIIIVKFRGVDFLTTSYAQRS